VLADVIIHCDAGSFGAEATFFCYPVQLLVYGFRQEYVAIIKCSDGLAVLVSGLVVNQEDGGLFRTGQQGLSSRLHLGWDQA
jgi:hypothetical protein